MARFRCGLVLVGVLALGAAACSSSAAPKGNLDLAQAEQEIHRLADRVYRDQVDVGAVRCPERVPMQEGLTFVCTVEIEGRQLVFRVRQEDDQGNVRFEQAQAVISTGKTEAFVVAAARKKGTPVSEVFCGPGTVIIRTPGKRVTCRVEFADGTGGSARLQVRDSGGKVSLIDIQPSPS